MDKNIFEKQNEIISDFALINESDKYTYLIEIAKNLPAIPKEYKVEDNLMPNCQSQVWVFARNVNGKVELYMDADSLIMKGMLALLYSILNQRTSDEVKQFDESFLEQIGIFRILSPLRGVGLKNIIKKIKTVI